MPRKRRHYILTSTAERDFKEARQWSLSRWEKDLTKQYFADLHEGAEWIAQNHKSLMGKDYLTGTTGLGIYAVREHYIVYVPVSDTYIVIVALIRQSRDVPAILNANGFIIRRELKEIFSKLSEGKIPDVPK